MLTPPELTLMPPGGAAGGIPLPPGVPGGRGVSICGAGAVPPSMTPERQAKPWPEWSHAGRYSSHERRYCRRYGSSTAAIHASPCASLADLGSSRSSNVSV